MQIDRHVNSSKYITGGFGRRLAGTVILAAAVGTAAPETTSAAEVRAGEVILAATGEPARVHNPACGGGNRTTADDVVDVIGWAIDNYTGYPIMSTVTEIEPEVRNRLKVMLGLQNGRSTCETLCVLVPRGFRSASACLRDNTGTSCLKRNGEAGIGWSGVEGFSTKITRRGNTMVCATGKNWSHDRQRAFSLTVQY